MRLKIDKAHLRKQTFAQRYIGDSKGVKARASTALESNQSAL